MAFDLAKRLTKYNTFERRDGGIMAAAYQNDKLIEGAELDGALISHYRKVHTKLPGFESERPGLPRLNLTTTRVYWMMRHVSQGKGMALDGISD